jgi:hypothetical protein
MQTIVVARRQEQQRTQEGGRPVGQAAAGWFLLSLLRITFVSFGRRVLSLAGPYSRNEQISKVNQSVAQIHSANQLRDSAKHARNTRETRAKQPRICETLLSRIPSPPTRIVSSNRRRRRWERRGTSTRCVARCEMCVARGVARSDHVARSGHMARSGHVARRVERVT